MRRTTAHVRGGSSFSRCSQGNVDAIFIIVSMTLGDGTGFSNPILPSSQQFLLGRGTQAQSKANFSAQYAERIGAHIRRVEIDQMRRVGHAVRIVARRACRLVRDDVRIVKPETAVA